MKTTILGKLLTLILIITLVPLGILGAVSIYDIIKMENASLKNIQDINDTVVKDSTNALNDLGATIIKNQALMTKQLLEMYFKNNPEKTADDLVADPEFQKLAIQPVGEKGYTTVILIKDQTLIAHPNPDMMGKPLLEGLRSNEKMQDWWRVVENTWQTNTDSEGYYHWPEADGTYSNKYMYLAVLDEKLNGTIDVSVAATTYVDEFNTPALETKDKLELKTKTIAEVIKNVRADVQNLTILFLVVMAIVTIFIAIIFARSISNPIKKLKIAADKITSGETDAELPKIKTHDEVAELISSMEILISALKSKK